MKLTLMELENLRHLIGGHELAARKCSFYAEQCQDPELRQKFQQAAQSAQSSFHQLTSFLN